MITLGEYRETRELRGLVALKLSHTDLIRIWKRCGLTADYGADYLSCSFKQGKDLKNSASMILNELIENAAKYSDAKEDMIEVLVLIYNGEIIFQVDNYIEPGQFEQFRGFVEGIVGCEDVNNLYLQKMMSFSEKQDNKSGIGLLTLMNYFNPKLGFKFDREGGRDSYRVSVQAALPIKE